MSRGWANLKLLGKGDKDLILDKQSEIYLVTPADCENSGK
jgi:hypothetical protein